MSVPCQEEYVEWAVPPPPEARQERQCSPLLEEVCGDPRSLSQEAVPTGPVGLFLQ